MGRCSLLAFAVGAQALAPVAVVPRIPPSQLADPYADGSARATGDWDRDAFLRGYGNCAEIEPTSIECASLPSDLRGTYYRNGFARLTGRDGKKVRHPFDADGMVTAVTLDSGRAVVRQRVVATAGAVAEREAGASLFPGQFGNSKPFWRGGAEFKNVANTNVLYHAGKLLALWEGSRPHVLDPLSLATIGGEWDVEGKVGRGLTGSFSAHPRRARDGSVANFAYFGNPLTGKTTVRFWDFAPDSFRLRFPCITAELPGFGLYHDFIATDNWFVVVAAPATWGPGGWASVRGTLAWIAGRRSVVSMIDFDKTKPALAYFFDRRGSSSAPVASVELDTFFSFHHANAFEDEEGRVVFDTVRADDLAVDDSSFPGKDATATVKKENAFILEDIDYERDVGRTTLVRYEVCLKTRTFKQRKLSPRHVEFPSCAPSCLGARHRYVYSSPGSAADAVTPQQGVLKTDAMDPANSQIWLPEPHQYCGEVTFAPKHGAAADAREDDGYLLTLLFDGRDGSSTLLVLDASRVADGPVSRVVLAAADAPLSGDATLAGPGHGLHASWVPGLVPTLEEIRAAEQRRAAEGARFLSD